MLYMHVLYNREKNFVYAALDYMLHLLVSNWVATNL